MAVLENIKWTVNQWNWNRAAQRFAEKEPVYFRTVVAKDDGLGNQVVVFYTDVDYVHIPTLTGDNAYNLIRAIRETGKGKISYNPTVVESRKSVKQLDEISVMKLQELLRDGKAKHLSEFFR